MSLPESHWKQFHDMRWPDRADAQIDHILVGPSGVYVIQYHSAVGHVLDDGGQSCETEVAASSEAARAVGALLPARYHARLKPVVCFREDHPLADVVDGVMVTSGLALEHILRSSPVVLSTSEVAEVAERLHRRLERMPPSFEAPRSRGIWRKVLVAAASVAAAVGVATFGPDVLEVSRIW